MDFEKLKKISDLYNSYRNSLDQWANINRGIYEESHIDDTLDRLIKKYTIYIKFDLMIKNIKFLLENFLVKNKKYSIWFPCFKHEMGSENAIVLECMDILINHNIVNIMTDP